MRAARHPGKRQKTVIIQSLRKSQQASTETAIMRFPTASTELRFRLNQGRDASKAPGVHAKAARQSHGLTHSLPLDLPPISL